MVTVINKAIFLWLAHTYAGEFGGLCFADAQQLLPEAVQYAGLWKRKENILKVRRLWSCHFRFPK